MKNKHYIYFGFDILENADIHSYAYQTLFNQDLLVNDLAHRIKESLSILGLKDKHQYPALKILITPHILCNIELNRLALSTLYTQISKINFDFVVLVSMRAIEFIKPILLNLDEAGVKFPQFIVMGKSSADSLLLLSNSLINNKLIVHYPYNKTGADAVMSELIKDNLVSNNFKKRMLYIRANQVGSSLQGMLRLKGFVVTECELYNYIPLNLGKDAFIKIFRSDEFSGIIITSGIMLKIIEQQFRVFDCIGELKQMQFIVTHNSLANKMEKNGFTNLMVV